MSYKDKKAPLEEITKHLPDQEKEALFSFIQKTEHNPRWYATNSFNAKYKGRIVYRFNISEKGYWTINLTLADPLGLDDVLLSLPKNEREFYFSNLRRCKHCNPGHGNGKRFVILGNEYYGCAEPEVEMRNPSAHDIEMLTKFVEIRKENIVQMAVRTNTMSAI